MDSLMTGVERDTRALALDEGRKCGTPGHDKVRAYLLGRMTEIGLVPFSGDSLELPFQQGGNEFMNLVGVVHGTDRSLRPLLLGAHYDSVIEAQCADDNAAAVAVCLSVAERLTSERPRRDVIIAIFDSEEPPHFLKGSMGSIRFHQDHCAGIDFHCAVIMDLIGHDVELPSSRQLDLGDLLFVLGEERMPAALRDSVRTVGGVEGLRTVSSLNNYVGDFSDHHIFRVSGQPYLFLSCGEGRHYHSSLDTVDWVNFMKVERVALYVYALVTQLDLAADAQPTDEDEAATTQLEIDSIRSAFGDQLPLLLGVLGIDELRSRRDLDRFAAAISGAVRR